MLNLTCKNAIRAVIYLSSRSEEGEKSSIRDISSQINASEHTVAKLLQLLARKQIITSLKGPSGGLYLDERQQEQAIITIVEAIEGEGAFRGCGLGLSKCSETRPCPIHDEYKVAREMMEKLFRQRKVRALSQSVTHGLAHLIG